MPARLNAKGPGEFIRDHLQEPSTGGRDYVGSMYQAYKDHLRSARGENKWRLLALAQRFERAAEGSELSRIALAEGRRQDSTWPPWTCRPVFPPGGPS